MYRRLALIFVFLFCFFLVLGQEKKQAWSVENVHLHLNKTTVTKGENLWFTAYLQDQLTQRPSISTADLHVALYNKKGEEVKRKLLHVADGIANGQFFIDGTFVDDSYLIVGWTDRMQNLKELAPFSQEIMILDEVEERSLEKAKKYVVKSYPEGGDLIADTYNEVGLHSTVSQTSGAALGNLQVVDDAGVVILKGITTNSEGFGKFGFVPQFDRKYFVQGETSEGDVLKTPLSDIKKEKIGLSVDNKAKEKVLFKLVASKEVLEKQKGNLLQLAVYQNEDVLIEVWKVDIGELVLSLDRSDIPYGINTAVLMDSEMRPIARRMFFNHNNDSERVIEMMFEHCKSSFQDSVQIDFDLPEDTKDSIINLSVSVLPLGTNAYKPDQVLTSSFLLQPYVNNAWVTYADIDENDKQGAYALDVKLLVEGWGRYDWSGRVPEMKTTMYNMNSRIKVSGKILDADLTSEKQVYLLADNSQAMSVEALASDKSFSAEMVLYNGDSLGISLIGKNGKLRLPKASFEFGAVEKRMPLDEIQEFQSRFDRNKSMPSSAIEEPVPLIKEDRTIALDEVVVSDKLLEKSNKLLVNSATTTGREVTDLVIKRYRTLRMYLSKLGLAVTVNRGRTVVQMTRHPYAVLPVFINGMIANAGEVLQMPLSSAKYIFIDKDITDGGVGIFIRLREGNYVLPENREKFIRTMITNGYVRPQEYFSPPYDTSKRAYQEYGAVLWKSNLTVKKGVPASLTIPKEGLRGVKVFVEGMTKKGVLVAQQKEFIFDAVE